MKKEKRKRKKKEINHINKNVRERRSDLLPNNTGGF